MTEISNNSLWYPRRGNTEPFALNPPLEAPINVPTPDEFRSYAAHHILGKQETTAVSLPVCLSALHQPEVPPKTLAFIDLDEVVGNLGRSLRLITDPDCPPDFFTHDYGDPRFIKQDDKPSRNTLIRLVKNHEGPGVGMVPVPGIDVISTLVRLWRQSGAGVYFLTSATPGAELSHVNFIAQHFRGACDGIAITRTPTGGYLDKGYAAAQIATFANVAPGTPAIAIDDIAGNTKNIRTALQAHPTRLLVATFQHVFPTNSNIDEGSIAAATPLEAFVHATHFLQKTWE